MNPIEVIKALILIAEKHNNFDEDGGVKLDVDEKIVVAASHQLVSVICNECNIPSFDFESEIDRALLIKAVLNIKPDTEIANDEKITLLLMGNPILQNIIQKNNRFL